MRIKLPREVSGEDLIEAVKAALAEIEDCEAEFAEIPRYEPGSVKKVLDIYKCLIYKTALVEKGWFKKRLVPKRTDFCFELSEIKTDQDYRELNMCVEQRVEGFPWNIEDDPSRLQNIEGLLEEFCRKLFQKLSPQPAAA